MTYEVCLAQIHSRKTFSSSASLTRIARLMDRLGNPQEKFKTVHVAGTNGKGSVCALVESALRACGYRVGLFTSPYLVDFRERIQIDRQMISKEELTACYEAVMAEENRLEAEGFEPVNEFELVTALGFLAFFRAQVEYAVMEVGLGGRCDATNILSGPEVVCITPVSLDHTMVLGDTVEQIAGEKAGVIKAGRPVVLARQTPEAMAVLMREAKNKKSPVIRTKELNLLRQGRDGVHVEYNGEDFSVPLLGRFQMENGAAAWEVCACLGLPPEQVKGGFSAVSWPGRLQYVPGPPDLLIDAGHNIAGLAALCETLDELFPGREVIAVMAMMRDKDYQGCIPMVAKRCKALIAATVSLPRSLPPEELSALAVCPAYTAASVSEGIRMAREMAGPEDLILVCGSVYAAGEALKTI